MLSAGRFASYVFYGFHFSHGNRPSNPAQRRNYITGIAQHVARVQLNLLFVFFVHK